MPRGSNPNSAIRVAAEHKTTETGQRQAIGKHKHPPGVLRFRPPGGNHEELDARERVRWICDALPDARELGNELGEVWDELEDELEAEEAKR